MRPHLALALVLGLTIPAAGCTGDPATSAAPPPATPAAPDPMADRLPSGRTVMVVSKLEDEMIPISPPGGGKFPFGSSEARISFVRTGDMGQVITDEDKSSGPDRPVTIRITSSRLSNSDYTIVGSTCTVPRDVLRAAVRE